MTTLTPRAAAFTAMLSGLLLSLTHGYCPPLAVLAPVPLLWALPRARGATVWYMGLACGVCEAFVLAGVAHAGVALAALLCLMYGLFRALFCGAVHALRGARRALRAPSAAALWALCELAHSALPYTLPNLLGDTQHVGPFLPLARLGGTYLISFQIVWLAALLAQGLAGAWQAPWQRDYGRSIAVAAGATLLLGGLARYCEPVQTGSWSVAVVQGGLPTWAYRHAEIWPGWATLPEEVYLTQTTHAPPAELTVWPETAVWRVFGNDRPWERMLQTAAQARRALLVGTPRLDDRGALFNSAVLLSDEAPLWADKRRLALLAEDAFTAGTTPALLPWHQGQLGVVFCLETVVPQYAATLVAQGADSLIALVEGGRFGDTPVGRLHAQRSVIRAVEVGRAVVHAGQQGYSRVIAADGTGSKALPAYQAGVVQAPVPLYRGTTPFVRWGCWPIYGWLALLGVAGWDARRSLRRGKTQQNRAA